MSIWAKFDIWSDHLDLDGQRIYRPSYMSVMQWLEWCEVIENPVNADEIRHEVYREVEREHEVELDDEKNNSYNEGYSEAFRVLEKDLNGIEEHLENIFRKIG